MIDRIYRSWDERSLRQMTPKREQILLERWLGLSKLGYLRFALMFLGGSMFLSTCFILMHRLTMGPYPSELDANVMARIETWFYLTMTSIFVMSGFLFSLLFYFGFKMWAVKIANWKAEGRL
jgi:hypothetical protein